MTTIQIKKDGQCPQVINVPEGAKIIIEDGVTIVEPEFKDGDIVFGSYNGNSWIGIFNKYINNNTFEYHARICNYSLEYSDYVSIRLCQRLATGSEKQLLIDILAKDGKQWNQSTKQIEELKYIPKVGDCVEFDYKGSNHTKKGYFVVKKIDVDVYKCGDWLPINHTRIFGEKSFSYDKEINVFMSRKITPEELQAKFNELGYEYNFETHTAEKLMWKPKYHELYYIPDVCDGELYSEIFNEGSCFDEICIEKNLAFKTPEEAIKVAKRWLQQL